jgi:hypothetical protein
MKQTAVEWLFEQLRQFAFDPNHHLGLGDIRLTQGQIDELQEQAKEMERQQIIDAFEIGEANEYKITRFQGYYPTTPENYYATEYDQTYE